MLEVHYHFCVLGTNDQTLAIVHHVPVMLHLKHVAVASVLVPLVVVGVAIFCCRHVRAMCLERDHVFVLILVL